MQLKQGSTLKGGKYIIEKVLGRGGFGITYLALQKVTIKGDIGEIESAIKITIKEFFMKDLCDRDSDSSNISVGSSGSRELVDKFKVKFIKEAQNIAKLKHEHIIKVLDVFEENGTAYYVMEYIDGGSLNEHVAQCGTLTEQDALYFTQKIATALHYIHNQNINHLDVKPSNILLKSGITPILIDFGLAKQYDNSGEQTSSTPVGVSKGYAPMEQYKAGGVSSFSPATDIYSLGATLYKLVTGKTPPEAHDIFDSGLPDLPSELSESVKKAITTAMQPSRNARPESVESFLSMLEDVVDEEVTVAIPKVRETAKPLSPIAAPTQTKPTDISTTKKSKVGAIVGGVIVVGAMIVGILFFSLKDNNTTIIPESPQEIEQDSLEFIQDSIINKSVEVEPTEKINTIVDTPTESERRAAALLEQERLAKEAAEEQVAEQAQEVIEQELIESVDVVDEVAQEEEVTEEVVEIERRANPEHFRPAQRREPTKNTTTETVRKSEPQRSKPVIRKSTTTEAKRKGGR